jgi:hypothetical protein
MQIWGSSAQDLYVAAESLYHSDGGAFTKVTLPKPCNDSWCEPKVYRVHGTAPNHVWVTAGGVAVYRYDGMKWDYVSYGLNANGMALYTDRPDHGWIGGEKIYELTGTTVKTYAIPPGEYGSSGISGFAVVKGTLYAAGGGATANVLRLDTNTGGFVEEHTGIGAYVTSITVDSQNKLWALSSGGLTTKIP